MRKDENTILFFGGNLIGVYPIKFILDDKLLWINDVLEIDDFDKLVTDIRDLPSISIHDKLTIAGDALNLSFLWIAHQALTSELLHPTDRETFARACINMLQYKFVSSIHTHNFKYPADIEAAIAVYERLENKSQLKKAGSWQAMIDNRTTDILGHDSLHTKTIRTLEDDDAIIKMINDIWNRLKSIIKILTRDLHDVLEKKAKIASSNKFMNVDGDAILKDYVNQYSYLRVMMHGVVPDRNAFIREDLIKVITLTVNTVYEYYLIDTLMFLVNNYRIIDKRFDIPKLVDEVLIFAFEVIREEKIELKNLADIAIKLRGILRASRLLSPDYAVIRDKTAVIIETACPRITDTNLASTRIAIILYIVLRSLLPN